MKLSNFKLATQLMLVVSFITLLVVGTLFSLFISSMGELAQVSLKGMGDEQKNLVEFSDALASNLNKTSETISAQVHETIVRLSLAHLDSLASDLAIQVQTDFDRALTFTRALAGAMAGYKKRTPHEALRREDIVAMLLEAKLAVPDYFSLWLDFKPDAFDGRDADYAGNEALGCETTGAFRPLITSEDGVAEVVVGSADDAEDDEDATFWTSFRTKKEYITPPYEDMEIWMVSATSPVFFDGEVIGIVGVDLGLDYLDKLLIEYKPYGTGYVYVVMNTQEIAWHPQSDLRLKKLAELSGTETIAQALSRGEKCVARVRDEVTKQEVFQILAPLKFGQCPDIWGLVVWVDCDSVMKPAATVQNDFVQMETQNGAQVHTLVTKMDESISSTTKHLQQKLITANWWTLGLSAGVLLVAISIMGVVARRIVNPLHQMTRAATSLMHGHLDFQLDVRTRDELNVLATAMQQIALSLKEKTEVAIAISKGDLTSWVTMNSDDDTLGVALIDMRYSLYDSVRHMGELASSISREGQLLEKTNQTLTHSAASSAQQLSEVATAITKLDEQTSHNANNAQEADKIAASTHTASLEGKERMTQMVEAMDTITKSAKEINKIIRVIDDIAFQTNLLALNAAVEAARAGQHGKGFAVVAEEVRNLAARSAKAAQETAALIEGSIRQVNQGSQIARQTEESLNAISEHVGKVSKIIASISQASVTQSASLRDVNRAVTQVTEAANQNVASVTGAAAAVSQISHSAQEMEQVTQSFNYRDKGKVYPPAEQDNGIRPKALHVTHFGGSE